MMCIAGIVYLKMDFIWFRVHFHITNNGEYLCGGPVETKADVPTDDNVSFAGVISIEKKTVVMDGMPHINC